MGVRVPDFRRTDITSGIVHMGVGGFHRSHQAVYTASLLSHDPQWGICGIGLIPGDRKMQKTLHDQDYLYSLVTKNSKSTRVEIIGSIVNYKFAGSERPDSGKGGGWEEAEGVIEQLASTNTKIVSLTITEKAYAINDESGDLDLTHPLILHDLKNPSYPKSPVGYVVAGLQRRRQRGLAPFTVLSCDNLPMNGELTKRAVVQYASSLDQKLGSWIEEHTAFPSTMVDKITPATTNDDIDMLRKQYSLDDAWPVCAEDYTQWVIEDNFTLGRPRWENAGALIVDDVKPYELMKLRLLNGSHSALAYLSYLAGHRSVHEAMQDDNVYVFIQKYMEAITPTVPSVPGVELDTYKKNLIERFSNPNISDQVTRLAEDGSKKMVGFIRDPIRDLIAGGQDTKIVAAAVAGWIRYCVAVDFEGKAIEIVDPLANELVVTAKEACENDDSGRFLGKFLGADLVDSSFKVEVDYYLTRLRTSGAAAVLKSFH
eukprot:CAMPEP_0167761898 /NCGR_PEP_ID=MMETSP0110_2-20121227/12439_1 /TAXON_ID=629695 /ORGANISM="Gymnochlora sp., Strain CCMP2014" /LENGTH=484 /DNA_ID=CAMNT_0007648655 /DNA_START=230 /DNA_END=1684 /DNA_ORIENTATION=-